MVRNNPTAAIGDYRTHGTNPGRVGLNLSVGAQHQLSEDWSLNASYSLELMERCKQLMKEKSEADAKPDKAEN